MENAPLSKIREIIAYAGSLEAAGKRIIHLEIGEPDFDTPAHIVDACKKALVEAHLTFADITAIGVGSPGCIDFDVSLSAPLSTSI